MLGLKPKNKKIAFEEERKNEEGANSACILCQTLLDTFI